MHDTLPVARPTVLPRGTLLGRYTLLEQIGAGGMGTVFAARDPRLDRRIAIKVLRTPADDPSARAELLREAQALAMLSHPNIVPIYDVGIADGIVWLAMAELRGGSLTTWLARERPWAEQIAMFVAVGRGLAAAHDAGLVHGDFKPLNVLLDGRGEPCVVDFGLARRTEFAPASDPRASAEAVPRHDESTRDGLVRGTPAYMAPEQLCGQPLDARTDQFAFCVALFTALYGRHPFVDDDAADRPIVIKPLLARIERGRIASRGSTRGIPRSLDRALVRGLAALPGDRWPSMHRLVDRLERAIRPRPLRWIPVLGAVVGAVSLAAWPDTPAIAACDAEGELADAWTPERAHAVASRLRSFDVPFAEDTAVRVGQGLESWASRWRARHAEVCPLADEDALRCLDEVKTGFSTTIEVLARADASTLARATAAVQSLPPPEGCGSGGDVDVGRTPALAALYRELAEIDALEASGRLDAALAAAEAAAIEADALGEPVAAARAHRLLGTVLESEGQYARAELELDRARWIAVEIGRDDLAVSAMASLIKVVGHDLARLDDGRAIERHAEAALARFTPEPRLLAALRNAEGLLRLAAGEPDAAIDRFADAVDLTAKSSDGDTRMQAPLNNYANALAAAGRYAEARTALERASKLVEETLGRDHPSQVGYASNLGFIADRLGDGGQARASLERAVTLGEATLGAEHPGVYEAFNNLAVHLYSTGDLDGAEVYFERALAGARKNLGAEHPALGKVIANLALCATARGEPERALQRYDEALALEERGLGPEHIDVAQTLNNRGSALRRLGRFAEARESYDRALAIRVAKLGPEHPDTATTINNLGLLAMAQGDAEAALVQHRRALLVWRTAYGESHHKVAEVLTDLAVAELAAGQRASATGSLERAEAIWNALDVYDPAAAGATRLALSELVDDDPPRARALARVALDAFTEAGGGREADAARARVRLGALGG